MRSVAGIVTAVVCVLQVALAANTQDTFATEDFTLSRFYYSGANVSNNIANDNSFLLASGGRQTSMLVGQHDLFQHTGFNVTFFLTSNGRSIPSADNIGFFVGSKSPFLAHGLTGGGIGFGLQLSGSNGHATGLTTHALDLISFFYQLNEESTEELLSTDYNTTLVFDSTTPSCEGYISAQSANVLKICVSQPESIKDIINPWINSAGPYFGFYIDTGSHHSRITVESMTIVYWDDNSNGSTSYVTLSLSDIKDVDSLPEPAEPNYSELISSSTLGYEPNVTVFHSDNCRIADFGNSFMNQYATVCWGPKGHASAHFNVSTLDSFDVATLEFNHTFIIDKRDDQTPFQFHFGSQNSTEESPDITSDYSFTFSLLYDADRDMEVLFYSSESNEFYLDVPSPEGLVHENVVTHYSISLTRQTSSSSYLIHALVSNDFGFNDLNITDYSIFEFNKNGTAPYWSMGLYEKTGTNHLFGALSFTISNNGTGSSVPVGTIAGATVGAVAVVAVVAAATFFATSTIGTAGAAATSTNGVALSNENPLYQPQTFQTNELFSPPHGSWPVNANS